MCGIAGYLSPRVTEGVPLLKKMTRAIVHRGPDDEGLYVDGPCGLGVRRLSIIDLSEGHQPISGEDGTVTVAFNGEIYNFHTLREGLIQKGHKFVSRTDTEVIVHLYEEKGVGCLEDLNGMFAFALYDKKKRLLFIARDRMGEKPLYYYHAEKDFVFGSEIKSILAFPDLECGLDLEALNMYLTYEYVPAPYSIYREIRKLEAGHYLLLDASGLKIERYWRPSFKRGPHGLSPEEAAAELKRRMERSVVSRTVSDVPLGAFLSGGIDSSLVTAFLARNSSRRVQTFNIGFEEASFDESVYSREVATFLGTDHHEEKLTAKTMLDILPEIMSGLDEPFADPSMIPTYLLSRYTRTKVKVALSGDGGDELFSGYPTYQAHKIARWIPAWMGRPLETVTALLPVSDENLSFDFKMKRFAAGIRYDTPARNQIWFGAFEPDRKRWLFNRDIRESLKGRDEFRLIRQYWDACDSPQLFDRIANGDMRFYLQDDILFKVDRMSMANSLEVRAPYLDHELVEFVCTLGPEMKLKGLTTKYVMKKVAEDMLPASIVHRKKKGFGIPVAKWIKQDLKGLFLDTLSEPKIREGGFFDPAYVRRLLGDHLEGRRDHRKLLWTLFIFEAWRQKIYSRD